MNRLVLAAPEAAKAVEGTLTEIRRPMDPQPRVGVLGNGQPCYGGGNCPGGIGPVYCVWEPARGVVIPMTESCRYRWEQYAPLGQPDDLLWVAETWAPMSKQVRLTRIAYRAGMVVQNQVRRHRDELCPWPVDNTRGRGYRVDRWRSSTTMPQWASRTTLRLTAVRAERTGDVWEWVYTVEKA